MITERAKTMQTWNAIIIKVLTASTEGYDMNDSADRWRREQPPYLSTACAYTCVCVCVSTTESIQDIDRSNSLHPRHHARPKGSSHKRCHGLRTVHVHSQARANLTKPSVPPTHHPPPPCRRWYAGTSIAQLIVGPAGSGSPPQHISAERLP